MHLVEGQCYVIRSLFLPTEQDRSVVDRLYDLGLYEGLDVKVIRALYSGKVVVLQFEQTLLALNEAELACLEL